MTEMGTRSVAKPRRPRCAASGVRPVTGGFLHGFLHHTTLSATPTSLCGMRTRCFPSQRTRMFRACISITVLDEPRKLGQVRSQHSPRDIVHSHGFPASV